MLKSFLAVSLHQQKFSVGLSTATTSRIKHSALSDFKEITKMRLSLSVVFSSVAGYFLGAEAIDFKVVGLLALGGYFMVGINLCNKQQYSLDQFWNKNRLV